MLCPDVWSIILTFLNVGKEMLQLMGVCRDTRRLVKRILLNNASRLQPVFHMTIEKRYRFMQSNMDHFDVDDLIDSVRDLPLSVRCSHFCIMISHGLDELFKRLHRSKTGNGNCRLMDSYVGLIEHACELGRMWVLDFIFSGSLRHRREELDTALMECAKLGYLRRVVTYVNMGARADQPYHNAFIVAVNFRKMHVAFYLMERGADTRENREYAMIVACTRGNVKLAQEAYSRGARLWFRGRRKSPLDIAVENRHMDLVRWARTVMTRRDFLYCVRRFSIARHGDKRILDFFLSKQVE